jgi:hypothetical protein
MNGVAGNPTIALLGTTTNDDASAGQFGEVISSTILAASAVALTTGTAANVTSISLTAGDWDVRGDISWTTAGTTNVTRLVASISQTSATLDQVGAGTATGMQLLYGRHCARRREIISGNCRLG